MNPKPLSESTDQELLQKAKTLKPTKYYDAGIIGFLIGVSVYSTVKNGFGLLTFLPLVYLPVAARNKAKMNEIDRLLKERGLK